ncbi:hypothetical protein OUZ56_029507 [Daphnia magna]|uniref:Uncharacterized protein n=1 Tax=Daphnia magna TaxID=35525 RepID=A0ABR0B716_9CRUS|nr:hypothetical protein OUZ56_029507 [Daphnia magna]
MTAPQFQVANSVLLWGRRGAMVEHNIRSGTAGAILTDTQTAGYLMKLVRLYGFTDVDLPVKPIRAAAMMSGCRGDQL